MTRIETEQSAGILTQLLKNPEIAPTEAFLAGQWKSAVNGKTFPVYEPSSETVLRHCEDMTREDFLVAIDSADEGSRRFYETSTASERGAILKKLYQLLLDNVEDCEITLVPSAHWRGAGRS